MAGISPYNFNQWNEDAKKCCQDTPACHPVLRQPCVIPAAKLQHKPTVCRVRGGTVGELLQSYRHLQYGYFVLVVQGLYSTVLVQYKNYSLLVLYCTYRSEPANRSPNMFNPTVQYFNKRTPLQKISVSGVLPGTCTSTISKTQRGQNTLLTILSTYNKSQFFVGISTTQREMRYEMKFFLFTQNDFIIKKENMDFVHLPCYKPIHW